MTIPLASHGPLACPISSLLPPSEGSSFYTPLDALPFPAAAIIGPLPATAPLHLGLDYLSLSDTPEYHPHRGNQADNPGENGGGSASANACPSRLQRVLLVTGDQGWMEDIEEEDEDWLRDRSGKYGVVGKLKRIDTRSVSLPLTPSICLFEQHLVSRHEPRHVAFCDYCC